MQRRHRRRPQLHLVSAKGGLRQGQRVLIYRLWLHRTAAVQVAKSFGADVTGVCSGKNVELVRSLGADRVIDYTQEDFTTNGETYDIIFDAVGKHSFQGCKTPSRLEAPISPPMDSATFSCHSGPHGARANEWCSTSRRATRRRMSCSSKN